LIKNFKLAIVKIRNNPEEYEEVYRQRIEMCNKHEITIPEIKKRKVSVKIDTNKIIQYFTETIYDEMNCIK